MGLYNSGTVNWKKNLNGIKFVSVGCSACWNYKMI